RTQEPDPFPRGKGNKIVESNLSPSETGNDREEWIRLFPFHPSNRGEAPHLLFLNTGCRAQPCRRKRETHRGFHIQSREPSAMDRDFMQLRDVVLDRATRSEEH